MTLFCFRYKPNCSLHKSLEKTTDKSPRPLSPRVKPTVKTRLLLRRQFSSASSSIKKRDLVWIHNLILVTFLYANLHWNS